MQVQHFFFLGIFPIINTLFDFISVGFTRFALSRGLHSENAMWAIVCGAIDLIVGIVAFLGLIVMLILSVHTVNLVSGVQILDLGAVVENLWSGDVPMAWLYFMVFSTLIPTALHFLILLISIMIWALHHACEFAAIRVTHIRNHQTAALSAAAILAVLIWFILMVISYGLWFHTTLPILGHKIAVEYVIIFGTYITQMVGAMQITIKKGRRKRRPFRIM